MLLPGDQFKPWFELFWGFVMFWQMNTNSIKPPLKQSSTSGEVHCVNELTWENRCCLFAFSFISLFASRLELVCTFYQWMLLVEMAFKCNFQKNLVYCTCFCKDSIKRLCFASKKTCILLVYDLFLLVSS